MSSSDRRAILRGLAALPLAGCGFTPVLAPGGGGIAGQIAVDPPRDRAGYYFVRRLEERLGQPGAAPYRLTAQIAVAESGLSNARGAGAFRRRLTGTAAWRLSRGADVVTSGSVRSFTAFSDPAITSRSQSPAGNAVTVTAAGEDALERLMVILADQIVARLYATAPDWLG